MHIKARHGNIKEEENDVKWLQGFDMVLSALDNLGGCDALSSEDHS